VILVDTNLLLYAHDNDSLFHAGARDWLEHTVSEVPVGFAWVTLLAFLRLSTSSRPMRQPYTTAEATSVMEELLQRPNVCVLQPSDGHWGILKKLVSQGQASGNLVMDAHLAALAIEHGALLCTTDRDFSRFPGLRWENPLET
jgi:toxin-antitoxin system PIN domain toxin